MFWGSGAPERESRVVMWRTQVPCLLAFLALTIALFNSCSAPPTDKSATPSSDSQSLPFDRQPRSSGVSPSQSLLPATTALPEGTLIVVRLRASVSSALSHSGDSFNAVVDEPVIVNDETLVEKGSEAVGRVLEVKSATGGVRGQTVPGYLRIVLVSLTSRGQTIGIETSSIFAKGGIRHDPQASQAKHPADDKTNLDGEVEFVSNRLLNFRLAQTVEVPSSLKRPQSTAR
jgi:hypothetical protein